MRQTVARARRGDRVDGAGLVEDVGESITHTYNRGNLTQLELNELQQIDF